MKVKLMIVDDEADVREFAARFFSKRDVDVCIAANGEEALRKVAKEKPRIILLDILMPGGIDGIETLRRIRETDKDVKVVMVTGREPEKDGSGRQAEELGAVSYIHKPLQLDELEKVVMKLVKSASKKK
ncbi:MAG: response regulator [Candidatus Omnitrophica bacterium]|nr:response regulator [Candidatus Omnitrophota bacterium]